ncbi:membrane lipoprotein lipid attachment site-containing protein [Massilia eburnea]|uniref:membrane lipoprotein lipid attachment site-containing protein n=1 Tax=Massilia eburnea TaxID=1776165 RepID=UPI003D6ADF90
MKKVIFAAVTAILVSGCADLPQQDSGAKEEMVVTTGSHIPRKSGTPTFTNTQTIDKEELARQVQNQSATINSPGR